MTAPRLILATRSPRRRAILEEAGVACEPMPAPLDDAHLRHGAVTPEQWTAALAYLKAAAIRRSLTPGDDRIVLGADTVVVKNHDIIGQPRDAEHARDIVRTLRDGSHRVVTGVAILHPDRPRLLFVDVARVAVGPIPDERIEAYLASGNWRGKAGAYNLTERIADGWPINYQGDPATIMGLPLQRLLPLFHALGIASVR
ncbi:MAG: Maf family protein [Planctomycetota bacterium]|nr:Maf family protein [Planctomycetota bacterium]